jgi:hypothetical protein
MNKIDDAFLPSDSASADGLEALETLATQRHWGWSLFLIGWLHLLAFSICHYLTIVAEYHASFGYLMIWSGEFCGMLLIFRICGGPRSASAPVLPLELFIRRVWITYFLLAFNLGSLNTLRGHAFFEFFPAIASLASFAFLMMTIVVHRLFFGAVLVMFASGLLMAAHFMYQYLIFAISWWLVLNGIGVTLLLRRKVAPPRTTLH